jgi:hypothetical protein
MVLKVINEEPYLPVLESDLHHTKSTLDNGVLFFNNLAYPPIKVSAMRYPVAHFQIKTRSHKNNL